MSLRSKKLIELSKFCDLESGNFKEDAFTNLDLLYEKSKQYYKLSNMIRSCNKCLDMNIKRISECVPGWGSLEADIMFVGRSLHTPGMFCGVPFILNTGLLIDAALRLSGIKRWDCFWSNCLHGHPEQNRASTDEEKSNCWPYLAEEIDIVCPRIVVALGKDAEQSVCKYMDTRKYEFKYLKYQHPANLIYSSPEARPNWIVKLSLDLDKNLKG
jgi:uracil-DNA glycosylase family 4